MLRVLQVLPALTHCGGIEAYLLNYYRHLDYQRVNFDFITHGEVLPEIRQEIESCGGRVFQADPISLATLRSLDRWIWQFLQQHAREYTAIHCHMANAGFLYFPLAQAESSQYLLPALSESGCRSLSRKPQPEDCTFQYPESLLRFPILHTPAWRSQSSLQLLLAKNHGYSEA